MRPAAIGRLVAFVTLGAGQDLRRRRLAQRPVIGPSRGALADLFRVRGPKLIEALRPASAKRDDSPDRFFFFPSSLLPFFRYGPASVHVRSCYGLAVHRRSVLRLVRL